MTDRALTTTATAATADWIRAWARGEAVSADFDALARARFNEQTASIRAFGAYAAARGVTHADRQPVATLPLVPVTAFKRAPLHTAEAAAHPVARFETSGTTDGQPGVVQLADTALYDLSLRASFHHFVVPDTPLRLRPDPGAGPFRVIALVPDRSLRPHSSLGHMAEVIGETWGDAPTRWLLRAAPTADHRHAPAERPEQLDVAALRHALHAACSSDTPVLLLTTSIALHLLHEAWPPSETLRLPAGSRVMDTGGPKGRRIQLSRAAQHAWLQRTFGLPPALIVGELGMTELCSQRYETVTRAHLVGDVSSARVYLATPWLRSVALAPHDLAPLPLGESGLIGHIDLANADTCAFLLTGDLGHLVPLAAGDHRADYGPALVLEGRAPGNPWRGCGLDVEAMF